MAGQPPKAQPPVSGTHIGGKQRDNDPALIPHHSLHLGVLLGTFSLVEFCPGGPQQPVKAGVAEMRVVPGRALSIGGRNHQTCSRLAVP